MRTGRRPPEVNAFHARVWGVKGFGVCGCVSLTSSKICCRSSSSWRLLSPAHDAELISCLARDSRSLEAGLAMTTL